MPKTSTQHDTARRAQIVAAAAGCFARSGFAATTIPDIVRGAGLSTGSIYHYFSSKEQLFLAVVAEYVAVYDEAFFAELQRPGAPLERLEAGFVHLQAELAAQSPARARIALELWSRAHDVPDLRTWLAEARERRIAAMVSLLSELCAAGELSPTEVADGAARLMALADGLVVQRACADFAALPGTPLAAGLRGLLGSGTG
ncbi:MAG: TetR/AcrR family transcriptional regulator [Chloroflexota bacterium]